MTDTPVPDAAVQIMKRRLVSAPDLVEAMATDLRDAGLLHDPAEVRRLRELLSGAIDRRDELEAEVTALRAELAAADEAEAERKVECPAPLCAASFVSRVSFQAERRLILHYGQVHAALPSADAPAPPQGEDADWAARRHAGFQAAIADTDARIAEAAAVPAGPQPPAPPQGEDDSEVWIPPRDDCMESRPDKPCPHCGGLMFHHRTRRCGECGRRPAGVPAGPQPADETIARYVNVPRDEVAELYEQNPNARCWTLTHVGRPCGPGCLVMRPVASSPASGGEG